MRGSDQSGGSIFYRPGTWGPSHETYLYITTGTTSAYPARKTPNAVRKWSRRAILEVWLASFTRISMACTALIMTNGSRMAKYCAYLAVGTPRPTVRNTHPHKG